MWYSFVGSFVFDGVKRIMKSFLEVTSTIWKCLYGWTGDDVDDDDNILSLDVIYSIVLVVYDIEYIEQYTAVAELSRQVGNISKCGYMF